MPQLSALDYVRTGQVPFFRLSSIDGADRPLAAVVGVPYDQGVTHNPGARYAPWTVRQASVDLGAFHPVHRFDVFERVRAVDGGNIVFPPFNAGMVREIIEDHVAGLARQQIRPFLVGGDHSIALPALRGLKAVHGPLAVIHFDAHLDTSTAETWAEEFHHGTPFRHALTEGLVGSLDQVGIRATWGSPEDGDLVKAHGGRMYLPEDVVERGPKAIARQILEQVGDRPAYISFDVDAIEPADAPGTGTPVPGGITAREALWILQGLKGLNLVGMDVVEVCPALDVNTRTSQLAAHLIYEGLALAGIRAG